ncbi:MAG: ComF family protein, partial [Aestuariivirgaceae bacterium]
MPFAVDEISFSAAAGQHSADWDRARGAVGFDDHSRRLVHALKYHDRHEVVRLMAQLMVRCSADVLGEAHMIVPVPLYWGRMWSRRFNQAALLAQRISRSEGCEYRPDILKRRRPTRSQVGLSAKARQDNVKGAFSVAQNLAGDLFGRNVVLVDDVLTTGATVQACAKALKKAGAA